MFSALRSIPSCTTDMNLRSCILNRHKMRQSQIATIQESLPSHFVICRILWSWPWRHKLSPITLKTCSGYLGEYPCSLLTWIWKVSYLPILALFHCYICLCVCHSVESPSMVDPQWDIWYWGSKWNLHTVCWSAVGCEWGTTSVYFGITYVCFIPSRLPVFAVEPQYLLQDFLFLSKVSFEGTCKIFKNCHVGLKFEWGL